MGCRMGHYDPTLYCYHTLYIYGREVRFVFSNHQHFAVSTSICGVACPLPGFGQPKTRDHPSSSSRDSCHGFQHIQDINSMHTCQLAASITPDHFTSQEESQTIEPTSDSSGF